MTCPILVTVLFASAQLALEAGPVRDVSPKLETIRAEHDLPGLVALGIRDGSVRAQGVTGVRSAESDKLLTMDDKFHLGSCAKAITAAMLATLVEDGELRFDSTIIEAVPDLESVVHEGFHGVTLLQLLQHRGGIAERTDPKRATLLAGEMKKLAGAPEEVRWEAVTLALEEPPSKPVGASTEYSNYGYMTAGCMAETVMVQTWQELMAERVFDPLEMRSFGFAQPGTPGVMDQPRGHARDSDAWQVREPGRDPDLPECIAPAGLVHGSMADWAKFLQDVMDGARGNDGLLKAETYQVLLTPPKGAGYACGWGVTEREWSPQGPAYTHTGSNGAWLSVVWMSPSRNSAAIAVCNAQSDEAPAAADQAVVAIMQGMGVL